RVCGCRIWLVVSVKFGNTSMSDGFGELVLAMVIPAAFVASWSDVRYHKVPNRLNVAVAVSVIGAQASYMGWTGLGNSVLGLLVGMPILGLLWAMRGMGAGDVKLMAAFGAWLGPAAAFYAVIAGCLLGGLLAAAM